jgi:hypothetical protein
VRVRSPQQDHVLSVPVTREFTLGGAAKLWRAALAQHGTPLFLSLEGEVEVAGGAAIWHLLVHRFLTSEPPVRSLSTIGFSADPDAGLRLRVVDQHGVSHTTPVTRKLLSGVRR